MSTTVKTGWLKDKEGNKFAPKTLSSQIQTSDGILLEDKIKADLDGKANSEHTHILTDVSSTNAPWEYIDGSNLEDLLMSIDSGLNSLSSMIADKISKTGITLGLHSDGKYYIFVDGAPVGTGFELSGNNGDVFGYVDQNNNIVLNGNLADGSYSIKYEMEDGSTVDIGNLVLDSNVYYSVTNNLTNCKNSNSDTQAIGGQAYTATITANSGYELKSVNVTMGGSAVSVSGGNINIANVTGNIVITAVAEVAVVEPTNLADPTSVDWKEGYRLSISSGNASALAGHTTTNFIPCTNGDVLRVKGLAITGYTSATDSAASAKIVAYNSGKAKLGGLYGSSNQGVAAANRYETKVTVDGDVSTYTILLNDEGNQAITGIVYIRIDGMLMDGYTKDDVIITINESSGVDTPDTPTTSGYTNLLPLSVDENGNDYKGTNGEDGYKSGYKISTSQGTESATSGACVSGFIPVSSNNDTIRVANITLSESANVNNFVFYDATKTKIYTNSCNGTAGAFHTSVEVKDGYYEVKPRYYGTTNPAFFRFSCGGITDDTIVTVNEEIV